MLSQKKVKARPPPLRLTYQDHEDLGVDNHPDLSPKHPYVDYAAEEETTISSNEENLEFYHQFESTLIDLLHEDELMPFNLHTAASLGITSSVRHLIER